MSTLPTKSFTSIVGSIAAGMQGRITNRALNFAIGTVLRGVAEAYAGVSLYLQYLVLQVAKLTRLSTSFGNDVDTWLADWPYSGVARLAAQAASGLVTWSRVTAAPSVVYVPVGALCKSNDGTLTFQVYADTTNPAFVQSYVPPGTSTATSLGGYSVAASTTSVTVPVVCITPSVNVQPNQIPWSGANGNVAAGLIGLPGSVVQGMDTVTNPGAFTNGFDIESDASAKARWALAVAARGGGTVAAYTSAVANLKIGMQSTVQIGVDLNGTVDPGMVTVVIDDGSGATPAAVVAAAQAAISSATVGVAAAGVRTGVYAATTSLATVVGTLVSLPGYVHNTVVAQVIAAVTLYINGIGLGNTLKYSRLYAVAQGVAGVDEFTGFTLNGTAADMAGNPAVTIKAASPVIS